MKIKMNSKMHLFLQFVILLKYVKNVIIILDDNINNDDVNNDDTNNDDMINNDDNNYEKK